MSVETAFGVSRYLEQARRSELTSYLKTAWEKQFGQPPGDLEKDLDRLWVWFRPNQKANRLRKMLTELKPITAEPPAGLPDSAVVLVDETRAVVTPEGRLLLELLQENPDGITDAALLRANDAAARFYGKGQRERLEEITQADVRPKTAGFVFTLLVNGSIGEDNAIRQPAEPDQEARLMKAIAQVLDVFSEAFGGKRLADRERTRMQSNWVLTEAARQLPLYVVHSQGSYWVIDESEEQLARKVAEILASHRKAPSSEAFADLLAGATNEYKKARPVLSALGLAHDKPQRTRALVRTMVRAYLPA